MGKKVRIPPILKTRRNVEGGKHKPKVSGQNETKKVRIIPKTQVSAGKGGAVTRIIPAENRFLSKKLVISKVGCVEDKNPERLETTWQRLINACRKPKVRGSLNLSDYLKADTIARNKQKNGTAIIGGGFAKRNTRSKADLESISMVILDFDDGHYTLNELCQRLKGVECVVHTSYSHSEKIPKFRALVLLDKPITENIEGVLGLIVNYFESKLGPHLDPKCRTPNQVFFTPSCPPGGKQYFRFKHICGKPLRAVDFNIVMPDQKLIETKVVDGPDSYRPGDDYNSRGSWHELLESANWSYFFQKDNYEFWSRPGKRESISGVVFMDANIFYVFSSAPEVLPFEPSKAYKLFAAYTLINHGGDFTVAAGKLKSEGYGDEINVKDVGENKEENAAAKKRAGSSFPEVPFPLDVFPDNFRDLAIAYSKAQHCSPEFMAANLLTVTSVAIGNAAILEIKKGWQVRPFIWFLVVGETGSSKSPAINAAIKPIRTLQKIEMARHSSELKKYSENLAAYKKRVKDSDIPTEPIEMRHYYSSDFTMEAMIPMFKVSTHGLLIHVDELAGFFNSMNQYRNGKGSDLEQMLSFFDCGPLKSDRVGKNSYCDESGGAIIGGIQPKRLPQVFNEKLHENGMVYRFIVMRLNELQPEYTDDCISDKNEKDWLTLVKWMYDIPVTVDPDTGFIVKQIFTVSDEGKMVWKEFFDELSTLYPFMPEMFRGYIPKLKTYCLKFMIVLHLLKCYSRGRLDLTVSKSTVRGAIKLTRYFSGQAMQLVIGTSKQQNPYKSVILKALISLQDEVKNGKLLLKRVQETVNESLLTLALEVGDKKLAAYLRDMGLEVIPSTGNKSVVYWNAKIILA